MEARRIVQSQLLTMSEDCRIIGNQGGISLLQMMEDMNRKIDEQNCKIDEQNCKIDEQNRILDKERRDTIHNRIIELLNLSSQAYRFQKDREERNARVHGANIELDLEVIRWLQENDKAKLVAVKQGFEMIYGLSFDEASSLIPTAPTEIIEWINKRSNLSLLDYYSSHNTQEISDMEQICTDVFDLWKESCRRGMAYPEDKIQAKTSEYQQLHSTWEASKKSGGNNGKKRKLK
jgi:hypothetical protein